MKCKNEAVCVNLVIAYALIAAFDYASLYFFGGAYEFTQVSIGTFLVSLILISFPRCHWGLRFQSHTGVLEKPTKKVVGISILVCLCIHLCSMLSWLAIIFIPLPYRDGLFVSVGAILWYWAIGPLIASYLIYRVSNTKTAGRPNSSP